MADETKRIIDQDADTSLSAGDYVIVDSQSEGTRKFDLGTELSAIKEDLAKLNDNGIDTIMKLTQAEYDAITTPSSSTLYIIVEEE